MNRTLALLIGIDTYPNLGSNSQLAGALADIDAIASLLRARTPNLDLRILREAQATRDGVVAAWNQLVKDAQAGDEVLFYWSGHGSQIRDESDDEDDGWDETLVPFDSGRIDQPNRDLVDDEIRAWLQRLTVKTPHVSLVIDSCHSGTVARSGARYVPRDPRPRQVEAPELAADFAGLAGPSGWLPVHNNWVLLAACRASQLAQELPLAGRGKKASVAGDGLVSRS